MKSRPLSILIMTLAMCCCSSAEPRRWPVEIESGRFHVHCDFAIEDPAALLDELQMVAADLHKLLGIPVSDEPIHIVLFRTNAEYQRYMNTYFPRLPQRRALFIQDRGPGMLFAHWHPQVAMDLRHEMTHALLNHPHRTLPLWLDEGLAEYFELARQNRFKGSLYGATVAKLARSGGIQGIDVLASQNEVSDFTDDHYRDSWAWVHFLIHRRAETRQLLMRFLHDPVEDVTGSGSTAFRFQRALDEVCPHLDEEFAEHFTSINFSELAAQAE